MTFVNCDYDDLEELVYIHRPQEHEPFWRYIGIQMFSFKNRNSD